MEIVYYFQLTQELILIMQLVVFGIPVMYLLDLILAKKDRKEQIDTGMV